MPLIIYCNAQYAEAYSDKLKMYTKVKASWLIKNSVLQFPSTQKSLFRNEVGITKTVSMRYCLLQT